LWEPIGTSNRETRTAGGVVTQVGIAKKFRADLADLPGPIARKAALWLMDYMVDPDDARFEAHRMERSLMPNL